MRRCRDIVCVGAHHAVCMASLLLIAGCAGPHDAPGHANVAALVEHDGYTGRWLRNERSEVFVAVKPEFRLLSFGFIGERSPMAGAGDARQGWRLACMQPGQTPTSFAPGNQPARFTALASRQATVRLKASEQTHTRYTVQLTLDAREPRLRVIAMLQNTGERARRFAAWSLTSFPRRGRLIAPFGRAPRSRRRLVYPFWTQLPQPGVTFGLNAMTVNLDALLRGRAFKVGLISDAGWIAHQRGDTVLLSHAPRHDRADYPEGNANATLFQQHTQDDAWAELEQVGPLRRIAPGRSAVLTETLHLLRLERRDAGPDKLRQRIEAAWHAPS